MSSLRPGDEGDKEKEAAWAKELEEAREEKAKRDAAKVPVVEKEDDGELTEEQKKAVAAEVTATVEAS
jgi:hypothetical protein